MVNKHGSLERQKAVFGNLNPRDYLPAHGLLPYPSLLIPLNGLTISIPTLIVFPDQPPLLVFVLGPPLLGNDSTLRQLREIMKILNWMQSKLNGRHTSKRSPSSLGFSNPYSMEEGKEELSDWPHGLLAIGTFGNNQIKGNNLEKNESTQVSHSPHSLSDLTPEEVGKLQKELTKLLKLTPTPEGDDSGFGKAILQLEKFINWPSALDDDRTNCPKLCDNPDDTGSDLSRSTSVVKSKGKGVLLDNNNNILRQRSLSFLLKKMFACHGGFAPAPSFRDPIPESRTEKLLRAILHKKIYPQTSPTSGKKYLGNKHGARTNSDDHQSQDKANDGCKWVKTDSEYIVLEI